MTSGFNTQILSHFLVPYLLLSRPEPILRQGAQICHIGRPGEIGRTLDMDDIMGLKSVEGGSLSLIATAFRWVFTMDLFTEVSPTLPTFGLY